jgi:predicted phage-related endonuclease
MTCTLDAQTAIFADGVLCLAPLECKNVSSFAASEWASEPPARVQLQLQHQMIVTGARMGAIAAIVGGGRFVWHIAKADDFVQQRIVNATRRFWHDYVEQGRQPLASENAIDAKVLREIYADALPKEVSEIKLPDSFLSIDKQVADATFVKKDAEKTIQHGRNLIQQAMGDHTVGTLSNGRQWKIDRKGMLRAPKQEREK